jgi:thiol:disulfide interchange protein DsbC
MRKYFIVLSFLSLLLVLTTSSSYAFEKDLQNCSKCHTLNAKQAKLILNVIFPDIKVLNVEKGPMKGLWEIGISTRGKKMIVYLDYSFNYLIAGNIFAIKSKTNLTEESSAKINKVDLSLIPYENALVMGDKKAKKRVVVFDDPD